MQNCFFIKIDSLGEEMVFNSEQEGTERKLLIQSPTTCSHTANVAKFAQ